MESDDVTRFGRAFEEFMQRMSQAARTSVDSVVREVIDRHLGVVTETLPVITESFAPYDHVNVQVAMSAYLERHGRTHELVGFTGQQRHYGSLSDVIEMASHGGVRVGSVDLVNLPVGPEATLPCVQYGLFLIADGDDRLAVLMRGPTEHGPQMAVTLEVVCPVERVSRSFLDEIRHLMLELNVFRGQVLSFGESHMGHMGVGPIVFHSRPSMERDQLILGRGILESIEREFLGIARHRAQLRSSGQHVKRGLLLHGPPGTGKTYTVRYIMSQAPSHTIVLLTGGGTHDGANRVRARADAATGSRGA